MRIRSEAAERLPRDMHAFATQLTEFIIGFKMFADRHDGNQQLQDLEKKISGLKRRIAG